MLESPESVQRSEELQKEVAELVTAVMALPDEHRHKVAPYVVRVVELSKRRQRISQLLQEALSQLRLDMKYLMFDLEATRRERDAYRKHRD